ncbi:MAG: acetyltransferase [Candidatus Binatia bacterium]
MDLEDFAKRIRDACLEAVLEAYEDAGVQGLCAEGRWEAAVGVLRTLDIARLVQKVERSVSDRRSRERY